MMPYLRSSPLLSSIVIQYLQDGYFSDHPNSELGDVLVLFVFCRYTEQVSARDILAALVRQALERHRNLLPIVAKLWERHDLEGTKPSLDDLHAALVEVSQCFKHVFCVLDGLDEALDEVKQRLLGTLRCLNIRLFITSRPSDFLEPLVPMDNRIEVQAHEQDIACLIEHSIELNPVFGALLEGNPSLKDQVFNTVKQKAGGM
jgi:ankyrin repeat domain-containing protein 50